MFHSITQLKGSKVTASDGDIGKVEDAYFDDDNWAIRYLVVDAGSWLNDRKVLLSPYAVRQPVGGEPHIHLNLTRDQVRHSPPVDTQLPVSRQQERALLRYHAYPEYWDGGGLWGMGALPYPPLTNAPASGALDTAESIADEHPRGGDDVHLRSSSHVLGYDIQATDESIGEVQDFIFDDENWAVRYLVVDTRKWWPGGRKVLIGTHWIDRIDWATRALHVDMTRDQVKESPEFEDLSSIVRPYEERLHQNAKQLAYWNERPPVLSKTTSAERYDAL